MFNTLGLRLLRVGTNLMRKATTSRFDLDLYEIHCKFIFLLWKISNQWWIILSNKSDCCDEFLAFVIPIDNVQLGEMRNFDSVPRAFSTLRFYCSAFSKKLQIKLKSNRFESHKDKLLMKLRGKFLYFLKYAHIVWVWGRNFNFC